MSLDEEIVAELRVIRALLAAQAIQGLTRKDAIAVLSNAGLSPKSIADTLGTTPGTVSVALTVLRKEGQVRKYGRA